MGIIIIFINVVIVCENISQYILVSLDHFSKFKLPFFHICGVYLHAHLCYLVLKYYTRIKSIL